MLIFGYKVPGFICYKINTHIKGKVIYMEIGMVSPSLSTLNSAKPGSMVEATSMAMLDKTLDMNEAMSQNTIRMMEQSVNPGIGGNFDMSV